MRTAIISLLSFLFGAILVFALYFDDNIEQAKYKLVSEFKIYSYVTEQAKTGNIDNILKINCSLLHGILGASETIDSTPHTKLNKSLENQYKTVKLEACAVGLFLIVCQLSSASAGDSKFYSGDVISLNFYNVFF